MVVAVDPPVTGPEGSDDCGIVVVGAVTEGPPQDWRAVVLEDASVTAASPEQWARAAMAAMQRHGADRLVAEVNQGGDLVEAVIRQIDPLVPLSRGAGAAGQGGAGRAGGGACMNRAGCAICAGWRAGGADVPDDGAGLSGRGSPTGWMRWSGR